MPGVYPGRAGKPEISRYCGAQQVQPCGDAVYRSQSEQRMGRRNDSQQKQQGENHRIGSRKGHGSQCTPRGKNAPDTDADMDQVMDEIDGKNAEQYAVAGFDSQLRGASCRLHQSRNETRNSRYQIHDAERFCESPNHDASP